jgi:tetratricopeptide (TPR) repeat protein
VRLAIAGLALCGLAATARADRAADRAEQLFKKGQKLLAEKRYAEACTTLEQSDRLDPEIGAKLNVARCYQEWGKLATAFRWFSDAEQMAIQAGDRRTAKIHALAEDLDRDVPRLKLVLPADAITDHLVVQLDGVELALAAIGDERRVDPGPHEIATIVDGKRRTKEVPVQRGDRTDVPLDVPTRTRPRRTPGEVVADPGRTRRLIGLGAAGAGGVAVGIAGIATLRARSDYQHALAGYCGGATDMCDATGLSRTHSARHRANIATAVTVIGAAAVAGGLAVYFTAPGAAPGGERRDRAAHALYLAPALGGDGGGVVLGGAF